MKTKKKKQKIRVKNYEALIDVLNDTILDKARYIVTRFEFTSQSPDVIKIELSKLTPCYIDLLAPKGRRKRVG
jgi:hypothetical protein